MGVAADVLFAVAIIAVAPGTVPEFQLRIGKIGSAADGAFVGIRRFWLCGGGFIGSCIERDDFRLLCCFAGLTGFSQHSPEIDAPGRRNYIQNIAAKEQEIVGQGDDTEQIVREGQCLYVKSLLFQQQTICCLLLDLAVFR